LGYRAVDGSGEVHELANYSGLPQDVSPDGKKLLTMRRPDISVTRLDRTEQPQPVVHTGEMLFGPGFSPDGQWIVYSVNARGAQIPGVYIQPFPGPGLRTQIAGISGFPIWRKDGKEIAIANEQGVWSVSVGAAQGQPHFATPELLFSGLRWPAGHTASCRLLAVSRDGSRFYFPQSVEQPDSNVIHVRMGW
jgi:hypothetical protein